MNDLSADRTSLVIAAEINMIKHQTRKILLAAAVEIGRLLKEAKELIEHGEWGKWLEESVSYSQRTATNLMRLFEEYGAQQLVSPNWQALADLNYTQALILLGVPEEERAQFIAEIALESLSTRELQKAVKERSQAVKEREQALQEKADLQKALDDQVNKITLLATERDTMKSKAEELRKSHAEVEAKAGNLRSELISLKQSTSFETVQRMSKNLTAAYGKASANKIAFLYESLDRTFKELIWELSEFAAKDPDTHEAYKNKVIDFLTKGLKERI